MSVLENPEIRRATDRFLRDIKGLVREFALEAARDLIPHANAISGAAARRKKTGSEARPAGGSKPSQPAGSQLNGVVQLNLSLDEGPGTKVVDDIQKETVPAPVVRFVTKKQRKPRRSRVMEAVAPVAPPAPPPEPKAPIIRRRRPDDELRPLVLAFIEQHSGTRPETIARRLDVRMRQVEAICTQLESARQVRSLSTPSGTKLFAQRNS